MNHEDTKEGVVEFVGTDTKSLAQALAHSMSRANPEAYKWAISGLQSTNPGYYLKNNANKEPVRIVVTLEKETPAMYRVATTTVTGKYLEKDLAQKQGWNFDRQGDDLYITATIKQLWKRGLL